jgi:hypothetical protein
LVCNANYRIDSVNFSLKNTTKSCILQGNVVNKKHTRETSNILEASNKKMMKRTWQIEEKNQHGAKASSSKAIQSLSNPHSSSLLTKWNMENFFYSLIIVFTLNKSSFFKFSRRFLFFSHIFDFLLVAILRLVYYTCIPIPV